MKNISIKRKSIVFASIILILAAILIGMINYIMSMNTTVERLTISAQQTIKAWSPDVKTADVEKLVETQDPEIQKKMIAHFDKLSKYQPQVAQGYLFGVELANGTDTTVISAPTFLMNEFADSDLRIGSLYTQPQVIVESIKRMKKSEKQTMSIIYTDSFGTWITVLKPLFDKDGKMFAYYGIDFEASTYISAEYKKMGTIFAIFIVLIILICLIQILFPDQNSDKQMKAPRSSLKKEAVIEAPTKPFKSMKESKLNIIPTYHPLVASTDKFTPLKEHSNHIKSAVYFIMTVAKDSHRNLVDATKSKEHLLATIENSNTATKLIDRLIFEIQNETDKSVQSFQLDTLLNSANLNNSINPQSNLTEITTQTRNILNNIEETKKILQEIEDDNKQLTTFINTTVESMDLNDITPLIGNQQRLFKKLIQTNKNMTIIIQTLNKLTISNSK